MAKRKRLTPAQTGFLETKSATPGMGPNFAAQPEAPSPAAAIPPIAQVARDSAATAALAEVTAELENARSEGRLIRALPLETIRREHLVRDRLVVDPDEMTALKESLRNRGQQTPIEVVDLGDGGYGLISGWRRITALSALHAATGEDRFATVQALLRTPETAEAAYTAMVEENEIRVALSPYERARIVAKSVEQGVFPSHKQALQTLFAAASRAKRSKIGSFLPVVAALDGVVQFPSALTERLGLRLSKAFEEDPDLARDLRVRLRKAELPDAGAETAWLEAALEPPVAPTATPVAAKPAPAPPAKPEAAQEVARGIYLELGGGFIRPTLTLSGPKVNAAFRARLIAWLQDQS